MWISKRRQKKVLIIGLDAAAPEFIFDKFKTKLPNLEYLINNGIYGKLKSTNPPITIPAWMSMCTGRSPAQLGLYGFRARVNNSYKEFQIATSGDINQPALWDVIAKKDKKSILVSVPPSYPPKPINGNSISCFITPDTKRDYTYPAKLKYEIEKRFGEFIFDVEFRTDKRDKLLREAYDMTNQHFDVIEYLLKEKPWEFFIFVEIGVDRVQHAFWKYFDTQHHLYEPGNEYENTILEYYEFLDGRIGKLLELIDRNTLVIVASDHGAKRMKGAFCINEWLIEEGFLVLNEYPTQISDFEKVDVNWSKTKAWGWGGYYVRIFVNVKGREEEGVIPKDNYESFRDLLKEKIKKIRGPKQEEWNTLVYKPEELFSNPQGQIPDLMVYLDNLYWRSAGTIGHKKLYLSENDKGPDDAVHDWDGIYILYNQNFEIKNRFLNADILDIFPTVLKYMEVDIPDEISGKSIIK